MVNLSPGGVELDSTFGALADPTRRAILARLASGEASVSELAQPFEMSLPAVSKHLKVLESAGLVERRRVGRRHLLRLLAGGLRDANEWIDSYSRFWQAQLDSLEAYLNRTLASGEPSLVWERRSSS